jgi:hypothetical protein
MVMSPVGFGHENDCAGEYQQQLKIRPILSSEGMLHKGYDRKCLVEKKVTGRESQGACRQDRLTINRPS